MMKEDLINSLKITIGVLIGVTLAKFLNMEFYTSVATIVIVSMLSAKKQSIRLALMRIMAALISLSLSSILFSLFGFTFAVFILYIFLFTLLMYKLDTKVAIVLNVVLVMHIYSLKELSVMILANELGLMILGIVVALLINMFVLDIEDELISYQREVEDLFNNIFNNMGRCLDNQCRSEDISSEIEILDHLISKAKSRAYKYMNNYYIQENDYYVEYFSMRRQQYYIVTQMQNFIKQNFLEKKEVVLLKDFTDNFVNNTKVLDSCENQLKILANIKHHFTYEAKLPPSLQLLQNRIALHQYLYSLEDLVKVKMRFIDKYEKKGRSRSNNQSTH